MLAGTAALAAAYAWLFRHRGSAGESWAPMRRVYFAAGLLVLLLALESPIDVGGDHYLFSLHMLQHLLLSMVVPPLLLLGLPPTLTLPRKGGRDNEGLTLPRKGGRDNEGLTLPRKGGRDNEGRTLPRTGGRDNKDLALSQKLGRALLRGIHPVLASLIFNVVLVTWHLPLLYQATLTNQGIHVLEHLSFLATGILFWRPVLAPTQTEHGLTAIGKIGYLGFAGIPPTILGIAFILSRSVLYPFYAAAPRVTSLGPLEDQQLAGLAMFGLGNLIYFAAIAVLFFGLDSQGAVAGEPFEDAPTAPIVVENPRGGMRE